MTQYQYTFRLYITGNSPNSERAIANLRHLCEQEWGGQFQPEIIDVMKNPQAAEDDRIIAVPTLIKKTPGPERRVIGDLSDMAKVREALYFTAKPFPEPTGEKP